MDFVEDIGHAWADSLVSFLGPSPPGRALHVTVDERSRDAVLQTFYGCMRVAARGHLYFVARSPAAGDAGWSLRSDEICVQYGSLREALARRGTEISPIPTELLAEPSLRGGLARFARLIAHVDGALRRDGDLVVVIAPVGDPRRDPGWRADVEVLLGAPHPRRRLVIVEPAGSGARELARRAGALTCEVLVDEQKLRAAFAERLRAQADAPAGASGWRATGGAGPRALPPPRPGRAPVALTAELEGELSPDAKLLADETRRDAIRREIARGAAALVEGDSVAAVEAQARVVALCEESGAADLALSHRLTLGAYVAAAGDRERARRIYAEVQQRAAAQRSSDIAAQALVCAASLDLDERRHLDAAAKYRECAALARANDQVLVAIDGLRACGDMLVAGGHVVEAIGVWRSALDLAGSIERPVVRVSTARLIARRLAEVCEAHGLHERAQEYRERETALLEPGGGDA